MFKEGYIYHGTDGMQAGGSSDSHKNDKGQKTVGESRFNPYAFPEIEGKHTDHLAATGSLQIAELTERISSKRVHLMPRDSNDLAIIKAAALVAEYNSASSKNHPFYVPNIFRSIYESEGEVTVLTYEATRNLALMKRFMDNSRSTHKTALQLYRAVKGWYDRTSTSRHSSKA